MKIGRGPAAALVRRAAFTSAFVRSLIASLTATPAIAANFVVDIAPAGAFARPAQLGGQGLIVAPHGLARIERIGKQLRLCRVDDSCDDPYDDIRGVVPLDNGFAYLARKGSDNLLVARSLAVSLDGEPVSPGELGRIWTSGDRSRYVVWARSGEVIRWWKDGVRQQETMSALPLVVFKQPLSSVLFAARVGAGVQLLGGPQGGVVWSRLDRVRTDAAGQNLLEYGLASDGGFVLARNGTTAVHGELSDIELADEGGRWMAVRRPADTTTSELLIDGSVVDRAEVDPSEQRLWMSSKTGAAWRWVLSHRSTAAAIADSPGARKAVGGVLLDLQLSDDGAREARFIELRAPGNKVRVKVQVDSVTVGTFDNVERGSLRFGPGGRWAFVAVDMGQQRQVISHLGRGSVVQAVSQLNWLADGRLAYLEMTRNGRWYAVVDRERQLVQVDTVHVDGSLRNSGNALQALATKRRKTWGAWDVIRVSFPGK